MHLILAVVLLIILGGLFLRDKAGEASYNATSAAIDKAKESFDAQYVADYLFERKINDKIKQGVHSSEIWPEISRALQEMGCTEDDFALSPSHYAWSGPDKFDKVSKQIMLTNRGKIDRKIAQDGCHIRGFGSLETTFALLNWMQDTFQKQGLPLRLWHYEVDIKNKPLLHERGYIWEGSSEYERKKWSYGCKLSPFDYSIIADEVAEENAPLPEPYYEQKNDGE